MFIVSEHRLKHQSSPLHNEGLDYLLFYKRMETSNKMKFFLKENTKILKKNTKTSDHHHHQCSSRCCLVKEKTYSVLKTRTCLLKTHKKYIKIWKKWTEIIIDLQSLINIFFILRLLKFSLKKIPACAKWHYTQS